MFKKINDWWESLCTNCGSCCYEKEFNEDLIFINMEKPCKYLDTCTKSCTIYDDRLKKNERCDKVNIFHALFNPYLPYHCGYVKKIRFWIGK